MKLDTFTAAYVEAMLWAETHSSEGSDNDGESFESLGYDVSDIDPAGLAEIIADCADFQQANEDDIRFAVAHAGHDFYLTRNGHGAGFWDGGWPEGVGERLADNAKVYGTQGLQASDEEGNAPLYVHG